MGREDRLASALAAVREVSQRTLPISTGGEEGEGAPAVAARPSQQQAAEAIAPSKAAGDHAQPTQSLVCAVGRRREKFEKSPAFNAKIYWKRHKHQT